MRYSFLFLRFFANQVGFTLIELIVVAGIISIITGIGVASYNRFNERQAVQQVTKQLETNLRLAQSKAISGIKHPSCGEATLEGWYIDFDQKKIKVRCGGADYGDDSLVELPAGISLTPVSGGFLFKSLTGDTNLSSELTITVTGFSYSVYLKVATSGKISFSLT